MVAGAAPGRPEFLNQLDTQVARFRANMFAESTWRTYKCHLAIYLGFCEKANIQPVPISDRDLACYAAYLAARMSYNSIKQYLNIVRLLHEDAGYTNPLQQNWLLTCVFKGIKRTLGAPCVQKLPITLDIMKALFSVIDVKSPLEVTFWCACVIAFFSFLRKSNLFFDSKHKGKFLKRGDLVFRPQGVILSIGASKTIQFCDRVVQVPLARVPKSVLCPAQAAMFMVKSCPGSSRDPLFQYIHSGRVVSLSYRVFLDLLKRKLNQLGYNPSRYAGHSFRRGGATLALSCNVPSELVKLQGDWASPAYLRYFEPSISSKFTLARTMADHITTQ